MSNIDQFECRKYKRDPNKRYTQQEIEALACSDGIACYEQQQKYNSEVALFNDSQRRKYEEDKRAWAANETKVLDWDARYKRRKGELRVNYKTVGGCNGLSMRDVSRRCTDTGWNVRGWNSSGCSGAMRRIECVRPESRVVTDALASLEPRPIQYAEPQRGHYGERQQVKTEATIGCCNNVINAASGTSMTDIQQSCNISVANIQNIASDLEEPKLVPKPQPNNNSDDTKKGLSTFTKVSIGIGTTIFIISLITLIIIVVKRKKKMIN